MKCEYDLKAPLLELSRDTAVFDYWNGQEDIKTYTQVPVFSLMHRVHYS